MPTKRIPIRGGTIVCDAESVRELMSGSAAWSAQSNGAGNTFYPRRKRGGKNWVAGRWLLRHLEKDLEDGQILTVRYRDGDPFNVRRDNLVPVIGSKADESRAEALARLDRDVFSSQYREREYRAPAWRYAAECIPPEDRGRAIGMGLVAPSLLDMEEARVHGFNYPALFTAVEKNRPTAMEIRSRGVRTIVGDLSQALLQAEEPPNLLLWDSCTGIQGDNLATARLLASHPKLLAPGAVVIVNARAGRDRSGAGHHRAIKLCLIATRGRGKPYRSWSHKSVSNGARMDAAVFQMPGA
jgi:hypothetical protein